MISKRHIDRCDVCHSSEDRGDETHCLRSDALRLCVPDVSANKDRVNTKLSALDIELIECCSIVSVPLKTADMDVTDVCDSKAHSVDPLLMFDIENSSLSNVFQRTA